MLPIDYKNYELLFQNKEFDKAFVVLEQNRESMDASLFHYNMGLLGQKLNKLSLSRFNFEKAQQLGISTHEMLANLELIKQELGVTSLEKSETLNDYFYASKNLFNTQYVCIISLSLLLLVLAFTKKIKKNILIFSLLTIIITTFSLLAVIGTKSQVILMDDTSIFEGPSKIFETTQQAPGGMRLVIEKSNEKWTRVIWPSRFSGWILNKGYKSL